VAAPQPNQTSIVAFQETVGHHSFQGLKRRRTEESRLERYVMAPVADGDVDVLRRWRSHSDVYPCLAHIARDYLAIPATRASAERVFSGGADLITDKQESLNEDTIQACICLGSWL